MFYEYCDIFGLENTPTYFMHLINSIIWKSEELDIFVAIFIDDIMVSSKTGEDHACNHLRVMYFRTWEIIGCILSLASVIFGSRKLFLGPCSILQ